MRFSQIRITNQDKLGQLLKANKPSPTTAYGAAVNGVLTSISNASNHSQQTYQNVNKKWIWKYAVSAAALAIVGIGIAMGHFFHKPQNLISENTSPARTSAPEPTITEPLTAQERVIKANEYGVVTLSKRSPTDIKMLMNHAGITDKNSEQIQCYEDERYLYYFNDDGTAVGVMATYLYDSTFDPETVWSRVNLSEEEAIALAKTALLKYCDSYTDDTADRFKIEAWNADEDDIPHFPEWHLTFSEYTPSGICRNTIIVEIDMYGKVAAVLFGLRSHFADEYLEQNEFISKESAIAIALEQFKKEERDVDLKHFTVTANLHEFKGKVSWRLVFEEIANENGEYLNFWRRCYQMVLDAISGEWIRTDTSR